MHKISSRITTNLLKSLKSACVEKDVENSYRAAIEKIFPGSVSSPNRSDGVLRTDFISVLMEFKFDLDLRNNLERSNIIIQVLYYLKKMQSRRDPLVKVIFIGDINECFCLPTKDLTKYLDYDVNWSITSSDAANENTNLAVKLSEDINTRLFIYNIDEKFDFQTV